MTRTRIEWAISAIAGLAVGLGMWFVSGFILMLAGFSFYAVHAAATFELILWIVAAPHVYMRVKKRNPHVARYRVAPLLGGALVITLYFVIAMAIAHP